MNYINMLNGMVKSQQEETKNLIMVKASESRYFIKLQTAVGIINKSLKTHIDIWEEEIKMGGFLNIYYRNLVLKRAYNICEKLRKNFYGYKVNSSDLKKVDTIASATYRAIADSTERMPKNCKRPKNSVNAEIEENTLPKDFLSTFCIVMYSIKYLEQLEPTIKKYGLEKDINTLKNLFSKYEKFIENEIIVTSEFETFEEYKNFVEKVAFDNKKDKLMNNIKIYKKRKHIE